MGVRQEELHYFEELIEHRSLRASPRDSYKLPLNQINVV
jgi:hypothetical protein